MSNFTDKSEVSFLFFGEYIVRNIEKCSYKMPLIQVWRPNQWQEIKTN